MLSGATQAAEVNTTSKSAAVAFRQDAVSASMAARTQKARVEVTDERTETTTVWANPNRSFTREQSFAPIRARAVLGIPWSAVGAATISPITVWAPGQGGIPADGVAFGAVVQ
ncbi:hypothetical protein Pth03_76130 [Planotetraspora thailandica]|uniref:Uncharacterized protein n=1 Tax=Planotetraspora thailandica TaxID=487172 RepID=A0A8J3Y1X0_9ACTN|nr:hypothetical protein Pth03_76130 [Planotetraspora thailandica]